VSVVRAARSVDGRRLGAVVGRAEQRARLLEVLDDVIVDGSRFVIMGGDAGVGKTTIIEAFLEDLSGPMADRKAQVISGQCVPLGGDGLPYAPVVGALHDLVALHGREQILDWAGAGRAALGALLPDLAAAQGGGDSLRLRLFEAVAMLWERASEHGPLVVIMEDIHWADESTRHLLRFLARALTDAPVMILTSYRTDELDRRHPLRPFLAEVGRLPRTVRIDVPSLERREVAELLSMLLGRNPSSVVIDLVHQRSEGIPYFVEELTGSASRGCVDMPDNLRDALNVRVSTLSERAQSVVRLAAVAGIRVDHELLEAVATLPVADLDAALQEAIDASVLVADETGYRFRHALLREAVHDDLLPGQHARLHAHFAAVLEEQPELISGHGSAGTAASEIAHHWAAAHEVNKAFDWSIKAATSGKAAYHETLKMYERALELWDQVAEPERLAGDRATVLELAAKAAAEAGETERALALVGASLAETKTESGPESRISRLILKSRLLTSVLRQGSVDAISEAVDLMPDGCPPAFRARVLNQLATANMLAGAPDKAVAAARMGIEAAMAGGSASLEAHARNVLGTSLVSRGDEEEGLAELAAAGRLADGNSRTMLRYTINYSHALTECGRYRQAADEALAGIEVARGLGLERSFGAMLAGNAAEPLLALGEWDQAVRMAERALELDPPANHYVHLRLLMGWVAVWRNDLDQAEAIVGEFRNLISAEQPAPQYSSTAVRLAADYALAVGDHGRAWSDVEVGLEHSQLYSAASIYPILAAGAAAARVLDSADRSDRRVNVVREALAAAKPVGVRRGWQPVIEASLEDSADAWRRAWKSLSDEGAPAHLVPYAGLRLAQHLVVSRDRAEAREVLTSAGALASRIGSGMLTSRLSALAQRAGLSEARTDTNPLAGLTAREVEVLQLIAEGKSNGDIGAVLFISTKTASVHVSNILAKLGVSSRGEAAALAHRRGLVSTV